MDRMEPLILGLPKSRTMHIQLSYMHIHDYPCAHIVIFKYKLVCCWCEAVHFVPMPIIDWLHSPLLQIKPFIDIFTFFQQSLVWLGCPKSECKIQSSKSVRTHTLKKMLITSMDGNSNNIYTYYMTKIYWSNFIRESRPDQLAPNTSVGNSYYTNTHEYGYILSIHLLLLLIYNI